MGLGTFRFESYRIQKSVFICDLQELLINEIFSSSYFLISVLLTGGIVGVAGQFRDWEFAAYAMYPFTGGRAVSYSIIPCTKLYLLL